jgi:hypothetical protein
MTLDAPAENLLRRLSCAGAGLTDMGTGVGNGGKGPRYWLYNFPSRGGIGPLIESRHVT